MSHEKLITVIGATGAQGGGLVRAILDDPDQEFAVRAVTRSANSAKARDLAEAGADVVEADLDDVESLRRAFAGAHGVYVVTDYWALLSGARELEQADNAALAAKQAGVAHVVWSTLEDTRDVLGTDDRVPTVDERFKVPHFDAKAEADAIFVEYDVPTTFLRTTFFFEGFAGAMGPTRTDDGLVLTLPMADQRLSGIAVADIGRTALGIFKRGPELVGETVSIAGDHLTGAEYAAAMSDALGEPVTFRPISWDDLRAQDFPGAVEMGNMFQYYAENAERFVADRDLRAVRALNPQLQSFRDWVAEHAAELAQA